MAQKAENRHFCENMNSVPKAHKSYNLSIYLYGEFYTKKNIK